MAAVKTPTCSPRLPVSCTITNQRLLWINVVYLSRYPDLNVPHLGDAPLAPLVKSLPQWVPLGTCRLHIEWTQSGTRADLKWHVKSSFI